MSSEKWRQFCFRLKCIWTFSRGPIGNSAALIRVVAWDRTDAKPFPKPIMTSHHLRTYVNGLSSVPKYPTSKVYYIDTFWYF